MERPILFSGPMVRAILEGRKSMTRRVVKPQPPEGTTSIGTYYGHNKPVQYHAMDGDPRDADSWGMLGDWFKCPYGQPGDRLWVREAWCPAADPVTSQLMWNDNGNTYKVHYRADGQEVFCDDGDGFTEFNKDGTEKSPWKPSIHMPRWASRITLEITGVRVERLQEITHQDAWSEGVDLPAYAPVLDSSYPSPRDKFRDLWDSINGKTYPWSSNPFVWVVEFKRVH